MYYKFLDSSDIDKVFIDGTIVISSFTYFRNLEETQWSGISDPLEGSAESTVKGNFVITENSPELEIINSANLGLGMFNKFAEVKDGGTIDISNLRFIHQMPNLFIYSVSLGDIDDLKISMCIKAPKRYDACLRVEDLQNLQKAVFANGRILNLGCRVDEIFLPGLIGAVEYEPRSRDVRQGPALEPSPFKKGERFKPQSEVRILFVPKENAKIPEERLIIQLPEIASQFTKVF